MHCLDPPVAAVPAGDWLCPACVLETPIMVALRKPQGGRTTLAVRPSSTVASLRDQIFRAVGTPQSEQLLALNGRALRPGMRLHDCGIQEGSEVGLAVKGNGGGRLEGFFAAGSAGWSSEEHLPAAAFYTTAQDARFRERPSSIVRSLDIDLEQLKEANKGWYTDFERCVADDRELHPATKLVLPRGRSLLRRAVCAKRAQAEAERAGRKLAASVWDKVTLSPYTLRVLAARPADVAAELGDDMATLSPNRDRLAKTGKYNGCHCCLRRYGRNGCVQKTVLSCHACYNTCRHSPETSCPFRARPTRPQAVPPPVPPPAN